MVNNLERVRDLVARKLEAYESRKREEWGRLVDELEAGRMTADQVNEAFNDFCDKLVFNLD
jgi:hypothetical protein